jgi:hypothetical protein
MTTDRLETRLIRTNRTLERTYERCRAAVGELPSGTVSMIRL